MGTYLERLKKIYLPIPLTDKTAKTDKTPLPVESVSSENLYTPSPPTAKTDKTPLEPTSVSFGSAIPRDHEIFMSQAMEVLHRLYAEHVARLQEAGHDGKGALVHRHDYWKALRQAGIPTDTVFELLDQGRIRPQADGLYWVPEDAA